MDNILLYEEKKESKMQKILYFIGGILNIILFTGLFAYLLCGIAFLISDYKITSLVDNCYIWEYNLCYIILIVVKLFLLKNNSSLLSLKFCNCIIILMIESLFLFIGTLTLINYNNSCTSLINTNLWFITICSYVFQIINFLFYSYFAIMIIIGELCKIKTPCCCLFNKN